MGKTKKYTLLKAIFRYSLLNFVKLNEIYDAPLLQRRGYKACRIIFFINTLRNR